MNLTKQKKYNDETICTIIFEIDIFFRLSDVIREIILLHKKKIDNDAFTSVSTHLPKIKQIVEGVGEVVGPGVWHVFLKKRNIKSSKFFFFCDKKIMQENFLMKN